MINVQDIMHSDLSLLLLDDDKPFRTRLARSMSMRGFAVKTADSVSGGMTQVTSCPPAFAVIEMRLKDGNGLDVIQLLRSVRPDARAVVLTGYGSIVTAVMAVKRGAVDYLAKPANSDDVFNALIAKDPCNPTPPENPMSPDRVRWEHVQRVYELYGRNVSETARRLRMHRRTLQRILSKRPPK